MPSWSLLDPVTLVIFLAIFSAGWVTGVSSAAYVWDECDEPETP
jgi:hypothetical protein